MQLQRGVAPPHAFSACNFGTQRKSTAHTEQSQRRRGEMLLCSLRFFSTHNAWVVDLPAHSHMQIASIIFGTCYVACTCYLASMHEPQSSVQRTFGALAFACTSHLPHRNMEFLPRGMRCLARLSAPHGTSGKSAESVPAWKPRQ
eukprot:1137702-Pelagomonas_calceolata.AAC.1